MQNLKCPSIFGHKYEARYSYGRPAKIEIENVCEDGLVKVLEASKSRQYVHDICVRCGHIVGANHAQN